MPSARPMATSMFVTKRLSSNACPIRATRPSATTIEMTAIASGIAAPTSVPNTISRMIIAAGSPNWISPWRRSDSETSPKSRPAVYSPVMSTAKPPRPPARSMTGTSCSMRSSGSSVRTAGMIVAWRSRETRTLPPRSR
jgi:hypothetical protein